MPLLELFTKLSIGDNDLATLLCAHLSKEMFLVSSCVATTGADRRDATCSSLGCGAPRRLRALVQSLEEGEAGEEEEEDRHGSVSQNTSCLS